MARGAEQRLYKPIKDKLSPRCFILKIHGGPMQPFAIDFFACYRGRFIGIEVKASSSEEPTKIQQAILNSIAYHGGVARVIWSVPQAVAILDEIDRSLDADA